ALRPSSRAYGPSPRRFFLSSRRRHTRFSRDWSSDVCSSDLEDFKRPPEEFSGGFQVRLNLAKVLAAEPNLLLLDEPSNYLDITSIRWLVRFLQAWKNELILVTHRSEERRVRKAWTSRWGTGE